MKVTCNRCGVEVKLDDPPEDSPFRRALEEIARAGLVCAACSDKEHSANHAAAQAARLDAQVTQYEALVPYEMRNTKESRLNKPWHKKALGWVYGPIGLLLHGVTRSGKTRCGYSLLAREFRAGRTCMRFTHPSWNFETAEAQRNVGPMLSMMVRGASSVDLLMIDDLGKGNIALSGGGLRDASEKLFDVLNARCENGLPTIITTQHSADEIRVMWPLREQGDAFVARLEEFNTLIHFERAM